MIVINIKKSNLKMRKSLLVILCLCSLNCFSQWTTVHTFNKPITALKAFRGFMTVGYDSSFTLLTGSPEDKGYTFKLGGEVNGLASNDRLYISTPTTIYEHLTAPQIIHKITPNPKEQFQFEISSINIFKNKKLVGLNTSNGQVRVLTFEKPFENFDTLDTKGLSSPIMSISSDAQMAFVGTLYSGGRIYDTLTKKWTLLAPALNTEVSAVYVKDSVVLAKVRKDGSEFYISRDYGKTYAIKYAFPCPYYNRKTFFESSGKSIFAASINGVFQSDNDGETWKNILANEIVTGLAILKDEIYVGTSSGKLLKKAIEPIITDINYSQMDEDFIHVADNSIYNQGNSKIEYTLMDITGKILESGSLNHKEQQVLNVGPGIYLISYQINGVQNVIKININK